MNDDIFLSTIKLLKSINVSSNIINICLLNDKRLAICSSSKDILIYNINTYQLEITLEGHSDTVKDITLFNESTLISCSYDQSIKIWYLHDKEYQCVHTIEEAHNDVIKKIIKLSVDLFATCSKDKTIKIWKINGELSHTLKRHSKEITSILKIYNSDLLLSGSDDLTLKLWNIHTFQCVSSINDIHCISSNTLLQYDDRRVVVCGSGIIYVVDFLKCEIEKKFEDKKMSLIFCINKLNDRFILCGCNNGSLCLFDMETYIIRHKRKRAHDSTVSSLIKLNSKMFISSSWDTSIKMWMISL